MCWTCASPIANQLHTETLRSAREASDPDMDDGTGASNIRSHLTRTCSMPDTTTSDIVNHDAIAYIRKCARNIITNKPHECAFPDTQLHVYNQNVSLSGMVAS